jgi:hypothetical protein
MGAAPLMEIIGRRSVMNHRIKSILIGLVAGALLGAAFGWVVGDNEPDDDGKMGLAALGPADYFQLGISILTLARQFGSMLRP